MQVKIDRNELLKVEKKVLNLKIQQLELTVEVNLAPDIETFMNDYVDLFETKALRSY